MILFACDSVISGSALFLLGAIYGSATAILAVKTERMVKAKKHKEMLKGIFKEDGINE